MSESQPSPGDRPPVEITFGDIGQAAWRKLREMRTVFQLLVIIALAALICTVVPQNAPAEQYYEHYGRFLGNIIVRLGLDHVNTTTWFHALLLILMLSLLACSRRLWQEGLTRWRTPSVATAGQRTARSGAMSALVDLEPEEAVAAVQNVARRRAHRSQLVGSDGERRLLYLTKHRVSAWGQALAHYAVFLIAIGSVLGSVAGLSLDETVDIQEGEIYESRDGSLPFAIAVDQFRIELDPNTGAVDNYYTDARLLVDNRQVAGGTISVNRPLKYRGYFISQSSWGLGEARVELTRGGKKEEIGFPLARTGCPEMGGPDASCPWGVPANRAAAFFADGKGALVSTGFFADAGRKEGKVVGSSSEYLGQPALNLTLVSGLSGHQAPETPHGSGAGHGLHELGWAFPGESLKLPDGQVKFVGVTKSTGLGIRKDSGLPLVWIGFVAVVLGLILVFYFPLRRSVVACEPRGRGRTEITMSVYGRGDTLDEEPNDLWAAMLQHLPARPSDRADAGSR